VREAMRQVRVSEERPAEADRVRFALGERLCRFGEIVVGVEDERALESLLRIGAIGGRSAWLA